MSDTRFAIVGDLSDREGYDFGQLRSITKVLVRSAHFLLHPSADLVLLLRLDGNPFAYCGVRAPRVVPCGAAA